MSTGKQQEAGGEGPLKTEVCSDTGVERPWRWESWQGTHGRWESREGTRTLLGRKGSKREEAEGGNCWRKDVGGLISLPGRRD